jgi:hypothetical protein
MEEYLDATIEDFTRLPLIQWSEMRSQKMVILPETTDGLHESGFRKFCLVLIDRDGSALGRFAPGLDNLQLQNAPIGCDVLPVSGLLRIWAEVGELVLIQRGSTVYVDARDGA